METFVNIIFVTAFVIGSAILTVFLNVACTWDFAINQVPYIYCPDELSVENYAIDMIEEGVSQRKIVSFVQQCTEVKSSFKDYSNFLHGLSIDDYKVECTIKNVLFFILGLLCFNCSADNLVFKIVILVGFSLSYILVRRFFTSYIQNKIFFPSYREEKGDLNQIIPKYSGSTWRELQDYYNGIQKIISRGYIYYPFDIMSRHIAKYKEQSNFITKARMVRFVFVGAALMYIICFYAQ